MAKLKLTPQIIAGFAATMSMAGAGFGFGWPSPSLPKLLAKDAAVLMSSDELSWIVSVFTIGGAIGGLMAALIVDRWGRKWLLFSTIIPHLISCVLIGVAQNFWWFIAARIISGLGTGMGYSVVPMYTGEIADDRIRGAVSGMLDPLMNISVIVTYCIGPWVSVRTLAIIGGVFPLVFGLIFIWMPETPYFLMMKQKPEQAEKSLSWLRGTSDVSEELVKIRENVESEQKNAGSIMDLVMIPGNRKALIIILGVMTAQQFSGLSAIISYSSLIFEEAGSTLDPSICVIIFGVCQTFAGVLTIFFADWIGRRPIILTSTFVSALLLVGMALYFQLQTTGIDVTSVSWLPVAAMILFIVISTAGLGVLPYVVISEIFSCNVKAWATMTANSTAFLLSMVVTKLYQVVGDVYGIHAPFWGFAGFSILTGTFIYFTLPETRQRSLQDIQDELHKTTESMIVLDRL